MHLTQPPGHKQTCSMKMKAVSWRRAKKNKSGQHSKPQRHNHVFFSHVPAGCGRNKCHWRQQGLFQDLIKGQSEIFLEFWLSSKKYPGTGQIQSRHINRQRADSYYARLQILQMLSLVKSSESKQSDFILRKINEMKLKSNLYQRAYGKTEDRDWKSYRHSEKSRPDVVQNDKQKGNPGRAGVMAAPETDRNTDSETVRLLE